MLTVEWWQLLAVGHARCPGAKDARMVTVGVAWVGAASWSHKRELAQSDQGYTQY